MRFTLVAVGRVTPELRDACDLYVKRANHYIKLDVVESPEGSSARSPEAALKAEAAGLLRRISDSATAILLTRHGERLSSRSLAEKVEGWRLDARDVTFVIGGAWGVADTVAERCSGALSLSELTLPHDLARLVFLEQMYRACTINRGEPYHKGSDDS